jgi:hypothetical protein
MAGPNLLIGNGQVLTGAVSREPSGSSAKDFPYSIEQARQRLAPGIELIAQAIEQLPENAKPRGEGTGLVMVHPAFLAKTRMPAGVFRRAGLRMVGSRSAMVRPAHDHRKTSSSDPQPTAELYVAGTSDGFMELARLLLQDSRLVVQEDFRKIEGVRPLASTERLIHLAGSDEQLDLEVVLHGDVSDSDLLDAFELHAQKCGATLGRGKMLGVPGLVFMPASAPRAKLADLAAFGALRAVRRLPQLRLHRPPMRTTQDGAAPALPEEDSLDKSIKVVVFDGGLGSTDLGRWSKEHVPPELAATHSDYLLHGNDVTSAVLFGSAEAGKPLPRPYFDVVHERVIGSANEQDVDLYDCMKRVQAVLAKGDVDFANLSLGPRLAIDDDQPHAWTAMLDEQLASGRTLATVAVGNDGAAGGGMGRIQPPGDAVNALAVGSADSREFMWSRAEYSCYGPGRSPGLVKPDGVVFGGTASNPLILFNPIIRGLTGVQGTSFAAPLALRAAAAARALAKTPLSATALRALMIQRADRFGGHDARDVGWGRLPEDPQDLLTCGDHEVSVLYQGHIEAGSRLRIGMPVPPVALGVGLSITATFCFTSPVDAADPVNYTRHGLTVCFRPKGEGSSASFFSRGEYETESQLRHDAHKWETVLHQTMHFQAHELLDACFDVDHGARDHGLPAVGAPALPYVLVVTISTQKGEPIYNAVMNRYKMLAPIELRSQVPVTLRPRGPLS